MASQGVEMSLKSTTNVPDYNCENLEPDTHRVHWTPFYYVSEYYDEEFWKLKAEQTNEESLQNEECVNLRTDIEEKNKLLNARRSGMFGTSSS